MRCTTSTPPLALPPGAPCGRCPHVQELIRLAPGLVFRSLGLGTVCQAVGGFLAGVPLGGSEEGSRRWSGANQGAFLVAVEIARFLPLDRFIAQMEACVRRARELQPVPGHEPATLPGGLEWERERPLASLRSCPQSGIPVGERHRAALARVGAAVGVPPPI